MECDICDERNGKYIIVNGDVRTIVCEPCLGDELVGLVTNNDTITLNSGDLYNGLQIVEVR